MKRNFFGEPIFERGESAIVLDELGGRLGEELWGAIELMDEDDPEAGYSIQIKDRETADTIAHVHNLASIEDAKAFCDEASIEPEVIE